MARFIIKNGTLENAFGKEKQLSIPDEIEKIKAGAFYCFDTIVLSDTISPKEIKNSGFSGTAIIPETWQYKGKITKDFIKNLSAVRYKDMEISIYHSENDDFLVKLFNLLTTDKEITAEFLQQAKRRTSKDPIYLMLCRKGQADCLAYVKKSFMRFAKDSIDRTCVAELKEFEGYGFLTKANTGKLVEYALGQKKKNNDIILYLLSVKDKLGGFKLEEIDKYLELALENVELTAALLEYKNKYFTTEQIEEIETDRMEKELGFKERTAAEWKKIFGYEVKDGEVTITSYKGSDLDVIIPETICKKPVTAIADMAFSPCKPRLKKDIKETLLKLKSVYIGDNIKTFGDDIFAGCFSLETVTVFDKTIELSFVEFGTYNGNPIKWLPLNIDFKRRTMLIISASVLLSKPYNEKEAYITWKKCTLREWLNEDFYEGFTEEEKAMIAETNVVNSDNARYGTKGGGDTIDRIFLLSLDEAQKYFANGESRAVGSWWWLRSPGHTPTYAAIVYLVGSLYDLGYRVVYAYGVRPALNLKF